MLVTVTNHVTTCRLKDLPSQLPSCLDNRLEISKVEFQENDVSLWISKLSFYVCNGILSSLGASRPFINPGPTAGETSNSCFSSVDLLTKIFVVPGLLAMEYEHAGISACDNVHFAS